jgi:hypothetical protein
LTSVNESTEEQFPDLPPINYAEYLAEQLETHEPQYIPEPTQFQNNTTNQTPFSWSEWDDAFPWIDFNSAVPDLDIPTNTVAENANSAAVTRVPVSARGESSSTQGSSATSGSSSYANRASPSSSEPDKGSPSSRIVTALTKLSCQFCQKSFKKQYIFK